MVLNNDKETCILQFKKKGKRTEISGKKTSS